MSGDIYLGKIFGIPFRLHWSWFLAVFLIVWTLSIGYFPETLPQYQNKPEVYWALGVIAALALFGSVLLHEMGHALLARRLGVSVHGIRFFVFGGIAEFRGDPKKPSHEIAIAAAGPLVTLGLIGLFGVALTLVLSANNISWEFEGNQFQLTGESLVALGAAGLLFYLTMINLVLLIFNLIPAFPLDGGRILRGIIWGATGDYLTGTRIAGGIGILFSYLMFIGGFFSVIGGNLIGGLWLFFLGMFLRSAAQSSMGYAQLQQLLHGVTVAEIMNRNPITIDSQLTVHEAVYRYFTRYSHKAYPVVEDGRFLGLLTLRAAEEVERVQWDELHVSDVIERRSSLPVLHPTQSVIRAWRKLAESGESRLAVLDNGKLVGLLTLRDVLNFVEIRAGLGLAESEVIPASATERSQIEEKREVGTR